MRKSTVRCTELLFCAHGCGVVQDCWQAYCHARLRYASVREIHTHMAPVRVMAARLELCMATVKEAVFCLNP